MTSSDMEDPNLLMLEDVQKVVLDVLSSPQPPGATTRIHKAGTDGLPACGSGDFVKTAKDDRYRYVTTEETLTCPFCLTDYPREAHTEAWAQRPI